MKIKKMLKAVLPPQTRAKLRKSENKIKHFLLSSPKTTIEDLESVLREKCGICEGDKLMVVSGFSNLNALYSPEDVVSLLERIVGENGLIMMPYYPPGDMFELYEKHTVFNMNTTKSAMGILTNAFSKMPNVIMSKHPMKAVCAWGKDAEIILDGHEKSLLPFGENTPYGKLLKMNSKSLGLGVKNLPMYHAIEDLFFNISHNQYLDGEYSVSLINKSGVTVNCSTMLHDPNHQYSKPIGDIVSDMKCKSYIRVPFGYSFVYSVNNHEILEQYQKSISQMTN